MTQKVENLQIKNFKAFSDVEIQPEQLNIITGRNNTGKSTILEAINIAQRPELIRTFSDAGIGQLINLESEHSEITLNKDKLIKIRPPKDFDEISFSIGQKFNRDYQRHLSKADVDREELTPKEVAEVIRRSEELKQKLIQKTTIVEFEDEKQIFTDRLNAKLRRETIELILDNFHEEDKEQIMESNNKVVYGARAHYKSQNKILDEYRIDRRNLDREEAVIQEKIERFVEEHNLIDNFSGFREGEIVLESDEGEMRSLPLSYMGDGFRAIIGLIRNIVTSDSDTILVEEPENHLHPGYISELVDFIVSQIDESDIQFFITTHSADFIEEFFSKRFEENKDFQEKFQIFRLQKRGVIEPFNYEEARNELKELKMDLRGT